MPCRRLVNLVIATFVGLATVLVNRVFTKIHFLSILSQMDFHPANEKIAPTRGVRDTMGAKRASLAGFLGGLVATLALILTALPMVSFTIAPSHAAAPANPLTPAISGADVVDRKKDPYGRDTPRGTVQGFMQALTSNDETLASRYLDLSNNKNPSQTVRQFKQALDSGGRLIPDMQISNDATGNLSDKLPPNLDKVGVITDKSGEIDLLVERIKNKDVVKDSGYKDSSTKDTPDIWLFSQKTLQKLPAIAAQDTPSWVDTYVPKSWLTREIRGVSVGHMLAVAGLMLASLAVCYLFSWLAYGIFSLIYRTIYKDREMPIDERVILPLAVVAAVVTVKELMVAAGVSVVVREVANRGTDILGWVASAWLLLRVIDVLFRRAEHLSINSNRPERISVLNLLRKVAKAVMLIFALIVILGNLGFDLTTGIAALGVGGLALALGAQKTVENLVGSIVVVADNPVSVGDYCRFGTHEGVVEDIGIRSTRIRTPNRTVLTIPNGDFSSMKIENFTARDMFQFIHLFHLSRDTKTQAMQNVIQTLENFIINHPYSNEHWNQVRIAEVQQDAYILEVRCYLTANGVMEFNAKQTQMILAISDIITKAGLKYALPTQQLVVENKLFPEPTLSNTAATPTDNRANDTQNNSPSQKFFLVTKPNRNLENLITPPENPLAPPSTKNGKSTKNSKNSPISALENPVNSSENLVHPNEDNL